MATAKKTGGEKTSTTVAKKAAIALPKTASVAAKSVAGSVLSQKGTAKTTSAKVGATASKILNDGRFSQANKSLAGSALTQVRNRPPAAKKK